MLLFQSYGPVDVVPCDRIHRSFIHTSSEMMTASEYSIAAGSCSPRDGDHLFSPSTNHMDVSSKCASNRANMWTSNNVNMDSEMD